MPFCVNCGSEVKDDARVCPTCNYPREPAAAPASGAPAAPAVTPTTTVKAAPTDGQAIAALVLGIVGLALCPIIPSAIALPLGRGAERRIKASGGTLTGEGMAKAGWIMGLIGLILYGFALLAWIVIAVIAIATGGFA